MQPAPGKRKALRRAYMSSVPSAFSSASVCAVFAAGKRLSVQLYTMPLRMPAAAAPFAVASATFFSKHSADSAFSPAYSFTPSVCSMQKPKIR